MLAFPLLAAVVKETTISPKPGCHGDMATAVLHIGCEGLPEVRAGQWTLGFEAHADGCPNIPKHRQLNKKSQCIIFMLLTVINHAGKCEWL